MGEMDKELPKIANIGWNNVKKGQNLLQWVEITKMIK